MQFPTPERRRRLPTNCRWLLSIALVAVTLIVIFFAYHNPSLSDSNILSYVLLIIPCVGHVLTDIYTGATLSMRSSRPQILVMVVN